MKLCLISLRTFISDLSKAEIMETKCEIGFDLIDIKKIKRSHSVENWFFLLFDDINRIEYDKINKRHIRFLSFRYARHMIITCLIFLSNFEIDGFSVVVLIIFDSLDLALIWFDCIVTWLLCAIMWSLYSVPRCRCAVRRFLYDFIELSCNLFVLSHDFFALSRDFCTLKRGFCTLTHDFWAQSHHFLTISSDFCTLTRFL